MSKFYIFLILLCAFILIVNKPKDHVYVSFSHKPPEQVIVIHREIKQPEPMYDILPTMTPTPTPTPEAVAAASSAAVLALPSSGNRAEMIRKYLSGHVLEPYSAELIATADRYGLDWRLLPVVSTYESSRGDHATNFNAWGLKDGNGHVIAFNSWEEGMDAVANEFTNGRYLSGLDLGNKLCRWESGKLCSSGGAEYRDKIFYSMGSIN